MEYRAPTIEAGVEEGPVNALNPGLAALGLGHNRSNYIDQLGKTGNLDPVSVAQNGNQHGAEYCGIGHSVDVFHQTGRILPGSGFAIGFVASYGVIPKVPLVEAEHHLLVGALSGLYIVAGGQNILNKLLGGQGFCQEILQILGGVSQVLVDGQVVHILVYMIQNGGFPLGEGGHFRVGAAGSY